MVDANFQGDGVDLANCHAYNNGRQILKDAMNVHASTQNTYVVKAVAYVRFGLLAFFAVHLDGLLRGASL